MDTSSDLPVPAPTMAPGQRIGDAERDVATSALSDHFAAGRLDRVELDARLESTYRATTRSELAALFADLPDPAPFGPSRWQRRRTASASPGQWRPVRMVPVLPLLVLFVVLVTVAGAADHEWRFPVLLPLLWVWLWTRGARRWHHYRG